VNGTERKVFEAAIQHYGVEAQQKLVLEEMSELQKEICKMWRGRDNIDHIAEEVADVEITLDQLKLMLNIEYKVFDFRQQKVQRQVQRLVDDGCEAAI
jgi:hypothetical protein